MSELKIDKLFREKVAYNRVTPSTEAWDKLSAELKKNGQGKGLWYWYAAASVAVLVGAGVILMNVQPHDTPVAQNTDRQTPVEKAAPEQVAAQVMQTSPAEPEAHEEKNDGREKHEINAPVMQSNKNDGALTTVVIEETTHTEALAEAEIEKIVPAEPEMLEEEHLLAIHEEPEMAPEIAANIEYPEIRIVYKSSKKSEPDKNALQKVVELARDIRQADIGLGTLREAKNELLALSLRKEKQSSEK